MVFFGNWWVIGGIAKCLGVVVVYGVPRTPLNSPWLNMNFPDWSVVASSPGISHDSSGYSERNRTLTFAAGAPLLRMIPSIFCSYGAGAAHPVTTAAITASSRILI